MNNFREALEEVLEAKKNGGGFHFVRKAQHLRQAAQESRQLSNLLKTPILQWKRTLSDTRYVLNELEAMGVLDQLGKQGKDT